MSRFRSYFSKNNTLIEDNFTNNSQNPVTEISYGTVNSEVTRFILDIDLEPLKDRIQRGIINPDRISYHILRLTNTIRYDDQYLNQYMADGVTHRASSFDLELFNLDEEWDEGSGYDFIYDDQAFILAPTGASNWYDRTTTSGWTSEGAYSTGSTILGSQTFDKGNENIEIDITDYVNARLGLTTDSGLTGLTASTGIGIKFTDEFEALETLYRQAVAFFARKTNTSFEPHIETIYDDRIVDDRNHFYLDKNNNLYLYANVGGNPNAVTVNSVEIIDYMGQTVQVISGSSIENVTLGVYKINVNIDSDVYPDAVLFTDRWNITQNGKNKSVDQEFYLITEDNYFNFDLSNRINFDNYFFTYYGIVEGEKIKDNNIRRVEIDVKQLYPNQNNNMPLDVEYRLYNSQTDRHQFEVIPWTKVNRTFKGYEFLLDLSWLVPQDYTLEFRIVNGNAFKLKEPLRFTVVSEGITTPSEFGITTTTTTTTTTTLPPTTTTTTTLPVTTTTTTTTAPNSPIFMSFTPVNEVSTFTNTNDSAGNGEEYELLWSTDSDNTQKYDLAVNGSPLSQNTTLNLNWQSSGNSYFELTSFTGVTTGATGATIFASGSLNINLSAGDNRGYLRFTVNNSGVTNAGFIINANNSPDPSQPMGVPSGSTDSEFVLRTDMSKLYGYEELSSTGATIFMVSIL